jgi:hypothetical protein
MAKAKSKKYNRRVKRAPARPAQPVAAKPVKPAQPVGDTASNSKTIDFRAEYPHVLDDLKRIGILAAAMFATLVVLALIIR